MHLSSLCGADGLAVLCTTSTPREAEDAFLFWVVFRWFQAGPSRLLCAKQHEASPVQPAAAALGLSGAAALDPRDPPSAAAAPDEAPAARAAPAAAPAAAGTGTGSPAGLSSPSA